MVSRVFTGPSSACYSKCSSSFRDYFVCMIEYDANFKRYRTCNIKNVFRSVFSFKINYSNKPGADLDPGPDNSTPSDCASYTTMETDVAQTNSASEQSNLYSEYFNAAEAATERVAELIHDDFECKDLFCQMDVLRMYKDDLIWKEMAR